MAAPLPGPTVIRVPARGLTPARIFGLFIAALFGASTTTSLVLFLGVRTTFGLVDLVVLPVMCLVLLLLFVGILEPRWIDLSESGLRVRTLLDDYSYPWDHVAPDFLGPNMLGGIRVAVRRPGVRGFPRLMFATEEQARALVNSRYAPPWVMPAEARAKWSGGLTASEK
jgi:hypothetical protein